MNYQKESLPKDAKFAASTPVLTEKTIPAPILKKHMAPHGKCGYLLVTKGSLQFVQEDSGETFDADPEHPIVIFPERYHHVKLVGPVEFRIEFYDVSVTTPHDPGACRPGAEFLS